MNALEKYVEKTKLAEALKEKVAAGPLIPAAAAALGSAGASKLLEKKYPKNPWLSWGGLARAKGNPAIGGKSRPSVKRPGFQVYPDKGRK